MILSVFFGIMQIMDSETRDILEETLKLSKENNKILHKMRNMMRVSRAFRAVYWMAIIGSMMGVYYYFQPFIDNIQGGFENLMSVFSKSQSLGDSIPDIGSLLNR